MIRTTFRATVLLLILALASPAVRAEERTLESKAFGPVPVFLQVKSPRLFIVFISGEEGWTKADSEVGAELARRGYLVAGVDLKRYFEGLAREKASCALAALDFEELSGLVQGKLGLNGLLPVLTGREDGATLAFAALAQARPGIFLGGISLGFCPRLAAPVPLCRGNALQFKEEDDGRGVSLLPCPTLDTPWIVIQGRQDKVCGLEPVKTFVSLTRSSQMVEIPGGGHELKPLVPGMEKLTLAQGSLGQLEAALRPVVPEKLSDLPLVEVPAPGSQSNVLVVYLTGDGGYGVVDRGVSEGLAKAGYSVVAWNSLKYYWTRKDPDIAARDLRRILDHYLSAWHKQEVVIGGYSLGADAAPFLINRLPEDQRRRVVLLFLLGPGATMSFDFHIRDWLEYVPRPYELQVLPEYRKLEDLPLLCFYGDQDKANICGRLPKAHLRSVSFPSRHRLGSHIDRIVDATVGELERLTAIKR